ncbi:hypothetical protein EVAR_49429_1 [Eumeta japonica]|uniref:Reverse transcriptase domain-containing protein n=1 Tax=Eumeta variegata TaxID=151549 RepID=A0A4C1YWY1_EUMVA|nr:hypothetical protein EVAR_49429_1 [Eumeta japonica]
MSHRTREARRMPCVSLPLNYDRSAARTRELVHSLQMYCKLLTDELFIKYLLYVNDQVIRAPSAFGPQEMINKINDSVKKKGMKVNVGKTKRAVWFEGRCRRRRRKMSRVERGMWRWFDRLESRLTKQICRANMCDGKVAKGRPRIFFADRVGGILKKNQILSTRNRRACMKRLRDVDEPNHSVPGRACSANRRAFPPLRHRRPSDERISDMVLCVYWLRNKKILILSGSTLDDSSSFLHFAYISEWMARILVRVPVVPPLRSAAFGLVPWTPFSLVCYCVQCAFKLRSGVSGSAHVRVCAVPRSVHCAATVKLCAFIPCVRSGLLRRLHVKTTRYLRLGCAPAGSRFQYRSFLSYFVCFAHINGLSLTTEGMCRICRPAAVIGEEQCSSVDI